ncbi:MAG: DLW-39 family protein [Actinomycetota bacterium]|nr:DLW-39 family protein [Actinomycetota bacterium]
MKKLLVVAAAAAGSLAAWRRVQQTRAEQDLWSEATDPIGHPSA